MCVCLCVCVCVQGLAHYASQTQEVNKAVASLLWRMAAPSPEGLGLEPLLYQVSSVQTYTHTHTDTDTHTCGVQYRDTARDWHGVNTQYGAWAGGGGSELCA